MKVRKNSLFIELLGEWLITMTTVLLFIMLLPFITDSLINRNVCFTFGVGFKIQKWKSPQGENNDLI
jgi:hypothetical protein